MDQERRRFFTTAGQLLLVLPAGCALSFTMGGCSSDDECTGETAARSGNDFLYTSSCNNGHTHTVTITSTELTGPPSSGIIRSSSNTSGHAHTISLTQAELNNINAGQTLIKTSSVVGGHSHDFKFMKV
ncbi:MAG TPA: hypothetical protein VL137_01740 [Polyangiaceae bacterium]|nr:hypothetical protein [Polyangiaceae bacterium]